MESLSLIIILPALVVGLFVSLFGLGRIVTPERVEQIGRSLRPFQYTLRHLMIGVLVTALALLALATPPSSARLFPITLLSLLLLAWFVRVWSNQFVFLMGLRDGDFPGRHDKLIWVFLLFAFAPVTVWFFRSYRLTHWPEPDPVTESPSQFQPKSQGTTASHLA